MKSNREFIDGIYAKAEIRRNEKSSRFNYRKAAIFPMAAAVAAIFILSDIAGDPLGLNKAGEGTSKVNELEGVENSRMRIAPEEYYLEGNVIKLLEPHMGYKCIEVSVNGDASSLPAAGTVVVAYEDTKDVYQIGDYVKATLTKKTIGTQEYLVIAR